MSSWMLVACFVVLEALLIWTCVRSDAPSIEQSLTAGSQQALAEESIDLGPGLVVDGRDAWLTGPVASEDAKSQAERSVGAVRGIRVVHNLLRVGAAAPAAPTQAPVAEATEIQRSIDELIAGRVVEFESGSDRLTARGRALVDEVAALLVQYPNANVEIAGHTDSQGAAAGNLDLSRRRAEAVRVRLVEGSVAASRLNATGYGEDRPIADNATSAGRVQNRRVEFTVQ